MSHQSDNHSRQLAAVRYRKLNCYALRLAAKPEAGRREVQGATIARKTLACDFFQILRPPLQLPIGRQLWALHLMSFSESFHGLTWTTLYLLLCVPVVAALYAWGSVWD